MAPQTLKKAGKSAAKGGTKKSTGFDIEALTGMTTEERRREIFGPTGKPRTPQLTVEEWNGLLDPEADFGEGDEFLHWLDEIRGRTKSDRESERQ
jgi:hypothetical protein